MPKYLARLARAEYHPGTAVLRRVDNGDTLLQLPMTRAIELLGHRTEVHYVVSIRGGAYHLDREVPPEELTNDIAVILGKRTVPGEPGSSGQD